VISEDQVEFYIRRAREVLWPNGVWAETAPPRSEQQKRETRAALESELRKLIPESVQAVIRVETVDDGVQTLLDSLSDQQVNKYLIYNLLEYLADQLDIVGDEVVASDASIK
jgi:hypothetical protein